jgi:enamine deaminase RidA (YjgF/YER057c/UK114 family)
VYSRVARINFGKTIFTSGLYGGAGGADIQIQDAFKSLEQLLTLTGSDLKHLAKVTYYVTDTQTSSRLNELRLRIYDAKRPPAASKATVRGVAQNGRTFSMDMIAVTKP